MRRAPFVVAATAAGLGLLLSYRSEPLSGSTRTATVGPTTTTTTPPSSTAAPAGGPVPPATPTTATTPTTQAGRRTADGDDVQYRYGDIELAVTVEGSRITAVGVVDNGATDPRSEQINSIAIPQLEQQALSAQSADIDGVSGATFTSDAFEQSLQSAINRLRS